MRVLVESWVSDGGWSVRYESAIMPIGSVRTRALATGSCRTQVLERRLQESWLTWDVVVWNCVVLLQGHLIQYRVHDGERGRRLLMLRRYPVGGINRVQR
jgi:hypothetical protein